MIGQKDSNFWAVFLSSAIKLELLRLFRTNPKLTSSIGEIAKQVGRPINEIQPELNDLFAIGVIKKIDNLSFCLDEDKDREIQAQISRYLLKGTNWTIRNCCETLC